MQVPVVNLKHSGGAVCSFRLTKVVGVPSRIIRTTLRQFGRLRIHRVVFKEWHGVTAFLGKETEDTVTSGA
jgi:hypothetical protein